MYQNQIDWCAQRCFEQRSGELSVAWLCEAFNMAATMTSKSVSLNNIRRLGQVVEPFKNRHGFRVTNVYIGGSLEMSPLLVKSALTNLVDAHHRQVVTAEEFYQEFETIHPFNDGNGRVGALLFNILKGTLTDPIPAPEYISK